MENDNENGSLRKPPTARTGGPSRQRKPHKLLEERLEDHNSRMAFLEELTQLLLREMLQPDPMTRAKLLARLALLQGE